LGVVMQSTHNPLSCKLAWARCTLAHLLRVGLSITDLKGLQPDEEKLIRTVLSTESEGPRRPVKLHCQLLVFVRYPKSLFGTPGKGL